MSDKLDIQKSLMQARWVVASADEQESVRLAQKYDLPDMIARLLNIRGVTDEQVEAFLSPTLAKNFPDPFSMAGMTEMAEYVADAIINGKKLAVFGDFDVDGATSTAIFIRFLRYCGVDAPFYIPDRIEEGYGPNIKALESLRAQGADCVLILDCGITSHDVIQQGRDIGLDICVFDHHEAEEQLPAANHVINPKRKDDSSGLDMLAACGVVFMSCVAINAKLREKGFFKDKGIKDAPLKDWLDIVALGTVCDMVPLTSVNRLFVKAGFVRMAQMDNPGIAALCQIAGVNSDPDTYHCGFVMGPRINAGSRVHQADLGTKLLSTDDKEEARNIGFLLEDCNSKRKAIQEEMMREAITMVRQAGMENDPVLYVGHKDWHPGLSGLVAGRLKEEFGKPSVVVTYAVGQSGKLEGRGSGRSVEGVNLGAAFIEARNAGLLLKGGGHAMAAGFTVEPEQEEAFAAFLKKNIEEQAAGQELVTDFDVDGVMSVRGASVKFVQMLQDQLGPFGQGQEEPVFVLRNVRIHNARIVGDNHISFQISDWEGGPRIKGIAFRAADTAMGQAMLKHGHSQPFHLAGHFKLDHWNGNTNVQMQVQDAAYVIEKHSDNISEPPSSKFA